MAKLKCDDVTQGLRDSEAVAVFRDVHGRKHYIRVERDFLSSAQGASFLPIGIVRIDQKSKCVLIELPHEAETSANRIWIVPEQLDEFVEDRPQVLAGHSSNSLVVQQNYLSFLKCGKAICSHSSPSPRSSGESGSHSCG